MSQIADSVCSSESVRRLHALVGLASSPAQSNRPARIVNEAVSALDVAACVFQRVTAGEIGETLALRQQPDADASHVEEFAARMAEDVVKAGQPVILDDLAQRLGRDATPRPADINSYLGVPLFDSKGAIVAIVALMDVAGRQFDAEDQWWLESAAQLAATALACEAIEHRLQNLEQTLARQSAPLETETPSTDANALEDQARKACVLLIDDDRAVNNVIRRFLTRKGFQVDSAFDGLDALRMFQPEVHHLVITDMVMPNMSGWELIAALRGRTPNLPIIIITGYSNNSSGAWNKGFLREQGVVAVLNKPLDFDYLLGIIEDIAIHPGRASGRQAA